MVLPSGHTRDQRCLAGWRKSDSKRHIGRYSDGWRVRGMPSFCLCSMRPTNDLENMSGEKSTILGSHRDGLFSLLRLRGPENFQSARDGSLLRHLNAYFVSRALCLPNFLLQAVNAKLLSEPAPNQ